MSLAEVDLDEHEVVHDKLGEEVASLKRVLVTLVSTIGAGIIVETVTRILIK